MHKPLYNINFGSRVHISRDVRPPEEETRQEMPDPGLITYLICTPFLPHTSPESRRPATPLDSRKWSTILRDSAAAPRGISGSRRSPRLELPLRKAGASDPPPPPASVRPAASDGIRITVLMAPSLYMWGDQCHKELPYNR